MAEEIVSIETLIRYGIHRKMKVQLRTKTSKKNGEDAEEVVGEGAGKPRKWMKVSIFMSITIGTILFSQALAYACTPFSNQTENQNKYILLKIAGVAIGVQWLVFLHAGGVLFGNVRTERFYDFTGACTFCLTSYISINDDYENKSYRQLFLTLCVLIWCIRLGGFLFWRINKEGGIDSRFTSRKPDLLRFMIMWTIQGFWVFATALPVFTLNAGPDCGAADEVTNRDILGASVWAFGMIFEVVADYQKTIWKMNEKKHGRFINVGLWSISRHPNYFGEIIIWVGVFIIASGGFCKESPGQWVSGFSPVFISLLLIFISGIPLLEIAADKKWGDDPSYKEYKENVPVLIPFIGRAGTAAF